MPPENGSRTAETAARSVLEPRVIQGGMGVAVSGWALARAVASQGQMGVVSGTALDLVHARRLGDGDPGGDLRRAYEHFPDSALAERVLERWYVPGGRRDGQAYKAVPACDLDPPDHVVELTVLANFAEVWLAREGHEGLVGINYLQKVELPLPYAALGAVIAGVDYVLVGAGIPSGLPALLDALAAGERATWRVPVIGGPDVDVHLEPREIVDAEWPRHRPRFLAIIASHTLAEFLLRDTDHSPDGFVVEGATAGGHNAPPRGKPTYDDRGAPIYGPRDEPDLGRIAELGRPFWLAGGFGTPEGLEKALASGAAGVQVGTAFALCDESGLEESLKREVIDAARSGDVEVFTDPLASPSGYPFKVAQLAGTVADEAVYEARTRVCDLGYLRSCYAKSDGTIGYRCASEPVKAYVRKGGDEADTEGRRCLCNALVATVGLPQRRRGKPEPPIVTMGDEVVAVVRALAGERGSYAAADVLEYLLTPVGAATG